jgi:L-aspartate oxidase
VTSSPAGIQRQLLEHGPDSAFLDLRHLDAATMRRRFPTIVAQLKELGLDLATDLIPVAPAAHYFMGGIVASTSGETTLPACSPSGRPPAPVSTAPTAWRANSLLEGTRLRPESSRPRRLVAPTRARASPMATRPAPVSDTDVATDPRRSRAPGRDESMGLRRLFLHREPIADRG